MRNKNTHQCAKPQNDARWAAWFVVLFSTATVAELVFVLRKQERWTGLMPPVVLAAYSWFHYKGFKKAAQKGETNSPDAPV